MAVLCLSSSRISQTDTSSWKASDIVWQSTAQCSSGWTQVLTDSEYFALYALIADLQNSQTLTDQQLQTLNSSIDALSLLVSSGGGGTSVGISPSIWDTLTVDEALTLAPWFGLLLLAGFTFRAIARALNVDER